MFQWSYLPVFRHFPQPLHSGGLEPDAGVQAPRDGLVDQCLPLLLKQGDEPLLACDVPYWICASAWLEVPDYGVLLRLLEEAPGTGIARKVLHRYNLA